MPFIENDHMVEQIPAAVTDPTLCYSILPRASEAGLLELYAVAFNNVDHFAIELRAVIEDQITRRSVVRKCLAQLLNHPGTVWMSGHVAVKDTSPGMRNDEEAVENTEGERRHGEEIHRGNCFTMVAQERRPSLCQLRFRGAFRIQRSADRSEISKPSIFSSP